MARFLEWSLLAEKFEHFLFPVVEYPVDISADHEPVHQITQRTEGKRVPNGVSDHRTAVFFGERMFVVPEFVRAGELGIHESVGRLPFGDFRRPAQGNAVGAQLIADQRSRLKFSGRFGDLEVQPRWREGLQICGVREEFEDFLAWPRKPLAAVKGMYGGQIFLWR